MDNEGGSTDIVTPLKPGYRSYSGCILSCIMLTAGITNPEGLAD